ncbi:MAG: DUF1934 domain-containing protein [Eubacteriales bacterium]|nr:DUF1934 domain-containing protein [Eubacteriales bacterium]
MVRIRSTQVSQEAGEDTMEFVTEAKLYSKEGALYLLYEESEFSGMPGCKTRLRLRDGEVQLKRFGEGAGIGNELKFEKGKRYTGIYDTPFGPIEIELLTNEVESNISEEGKGQVDIDYEVSLKGLLEGRNKMNITLM